MATLLYGNQFVSTTLSVAGGINASQTTGIVLSSTTGIDTTKPGIAAVTWADPLDEDTVEWVEYSSIDGSKELQGVTRGAEGGTGRTHDNGAVVAFPISEGHINRIADRLTGVDTTVVNDTSDNEIITVSEVASAVNQIDFSNNATGSAPIIAAEGGDTNIDLEIKGKGTGTVKRPVSVSVPVSTYGNDIATGDGKAFIDIPAEIAGYNLASVFAAFDPANPPTGSTADIQIHNDTQNADMLTTKLTVDASEATSATAATPAVIDTANDDVAVNDRIRIDIDQVGSTNAGQGLGVVLQFLAP